MHPPLPHPIDAFRTYRLLGDLLRTQLPLDMSDIPEELRSDLILRDVDCDAEAGIGFAEDSSRSLLDEGLEVRHPTK